ncbi:hypothetical protein B0A48_18713 [Cryoendolithus antarcticus]|uniref:PNPLA domain-containing protein n=1 Tax=Cryoendolithus antarcticus TaxID=1507870 RepID=A0A1V8S7Y6_9PEZI|nr:hypothetical protein B0A48_18713 [Cryoendolithus antarcticus]
MDSDVNTVTNKIVDLPVAVLFDEMYRDHCLLALQETYRQPETSERVMRNRSCLVCGQSNQPATIQLLPPTAGIRVLSLDGGGVKGIIPLTFLDQLEKHLAEFQIPIRDRFDFVCGGLFSIGPFIMRWPIKFCIEKFESLAQRTFVRSRQANYLITIEESFQSAFGKDVQLFNPPLPFEDDVPVSEAKLYHPPLLGSSNLVYSDTSEHGGLQHRNPLNIAMWELRNLWPSRVLDFTLSIGTGVSQASTVAYGTAPYSFGKGSFIARVFRTFMKSMDGERVWREIYNSLA